GDQVRPLPTKWCYQRWLATTQPVDWSASPLRAPSGGGPGADPVQKRVPGEWMTQKGVDPKARYRSVCVMDATGKVVREGRAASDPAALIAWFAALGMGLT